MSDDLRVVFWGCRGSVPSSCPNNARYGANTTCFEIQSDVLNSRIVIDAGTGIAQLGLKLQSENVPKLPIHIFFSHSHWDHIQGFPFFPPVYDPEQSIVIHYPSEFFDYREILSQQMSPPFFPGTIDLLKADIEYRPFRNEPITVDGVTIQPFALRHSQDQRSQAFVAGFEGEGPRLAVASDRQEVPAESHDEIEARFRDTIQGIPLLVHDASFTDEDFDIHPDWGHCSISFVVEEAQRVGAKQLCLHHFNPEYCDDAVDALLETAKKINTNGSLSITAAREGRSIAVSAPAVL